MEEKTIKTSEKWSHERREKMIENDKNAKK